ncbi:NLI interacting factor-like phosphatase FCP1/BRCT/HAD domain containing protein [Cryptosporidium felis]|nr:NLI interacting factor-like phosphatase FCP1/BRCT/HAD domain containing protein [Cryptosporidium felis]
MQEKGRQLTKSELVKILNKSTSSTREKNQAIKQLKKFPSNQKDVLDKDLDNLKFKVGKNKLFHFLCDKPKQSNIQVKCELKGSSYTICHCCYLSLQSSIELKELKALNLR